MMHFSIISGSGNNNVSPSGVISLVVFLLADDNGCSCCNNASESSFVGRRKKNLDAPSVVLFVESELVNRSINS